ncbi:O-antigen ligase family protein [Patescibacteria group bacterium]|nr:O-antigen ligase family protein [Patescibacteria group bacterium]MBU1448890.1 O-antigen ligase family protein [Patescibacteria group bacterium]MBU2613026.1 O-antigen ligase family protein [Patescibacteria group bacterium]
MREFSWGIALLVGVGAIFVALEVPLGPIVILGIVIAFILTYRYTYGVLYLAIALSPFLGLMISIPTGELAIGERAFGGSVDIGVAEALFLFVLAAWAVKVLVLWVRRKDKNWRPTLPLIRSYAALVAAHFLSLLSPYAPDPILVAKASIRPVLFCYLVYVAIPVNLLRNRRRLVTVFSILAVVGTIGALNGLVSLFFVDASSQFIRRAHPLPIFGVSALGDNHNLLAELMVTTVLMTLAAALLARKERVRRLLFGSAALQFAIGLLTFSRTGWIVFGLQAAFLAVVGYRATIRRHLGAVLAVILLLIPLTGVMLRIGLSNVAMSSNSTRVALLEIAMQVWESSPWIGGGAGTFVDRVGSAQVFLIEYGAPLDSHGMLPKLAAETGLVGFLAFVWVMGTFVWLAATRLKTITDPIVRRAVLLVLASAGGAVAYQMLNTNYWTGKMWLPVGLAVASLFAFSRTGRHKPTTNV